MSDIEQAFHEAMRNTYHESSKIGYRPNYFLRMVNERGGLETARSLLAKKSDGFGKLGDLGRYDLTVEAQVLRPEFRDLFTNEERETARQRLQGIGYTPPWLDGSGQQQSTEVALSDEGVTGVDMGLRGSDQIRIALQVMVNDGGTASIQHIYDAIEADPRMQQQQLSNTGKASLRYLINSVAVEQGLVLPYDKSNPGWHITAKGRQLLEQKGPISEPDEFRIDGDIIQEEPLDTAQHLTSERKEEDEPDIGLEASDTGLREWQAQQHPKKPLVQAAVRQIPEWLTATFGDRIEIRQYGTELGVFVGGRWRIFYNFSTERDLYALIASTDPEIIEYLQDNLSDPTSLRPRAYASADGYRFYIRTQEDYEILLSVSHQVISDSTQISKPIPIGPDNIWPQQVDGPAFVIIHRSDYSTQRYGRSYEFSNRAGGAWKQLYNTALAAHNGGRPVYVIIYRPLAYRQFTAWARVTNISDLPATVAGEERWSLTLEHHEFPEAVDPKQLSSKISWLSQGLAVAFKGKSIRPIPTENFMTIIEAAKRAAGITVTEARLPGAWPSLADYLSFIRQIEDRAYSADELHQLVQQVGGDLTNSAGTDEAAEELGQLRLLTGSGANYVRQPYVPAQPTIGEGYALLRLMALGLLARVEGSAEHYELPTLDILRRLRAADMPQPAETFAPALGPDGRQLLEWYAEARLVEVADDLWSWAADAFEPLANFPDTAPDSPTVAMYNRFLAALLAEVDGTLRTDLEPAQGPLPEALRLEEALRELAQDLLVEPGTLLRIYRSLMAGRHIVLSGPPGTGKTEIARQLPSLLWQEGEHTFEQLTTDLDAPPVDTRTVQREGYNPIIVTATEDWGVRDVIGGISPKLDGQSGGLGYAIQYGHLTQAVLQHYGGTDGGKRLPAAIEGGKRSFERRDVQREGRRYRGAWLVIDEFTRASVDAAFGGLLTTLGGGANASLAAPSGDLSTVDVPLPEDFRIIGTLNSFDRHFLHQMSEAIKRRFDFIDVLPPAQAYAPYERGIAAKKALARLRSNGLTRIKETADGGEEWPGVVAARPVSDGGIPRYELVFLGDTAAQAALESFWRIFEAVRIFRQLGTAQAIAVYTNIFAGALFHQPWDEALDTALADSLADQLQVLTRDEQTIILSYLDNADKPDTLAESLDALKLPQGRRATLAHALREADEQRNGNRSIDTSGSTLPTAEQLARVFDMMTPLALPPISIFRRRLRSLINERGL